MNVKETVEYIYKANTTDFTSGVDDAKKSSNDMSRSVDNDHKDIADATDKSTKSNKDLADSNKDVSKESKKTGTVVGNEQKKAQAGNSKSIKGLMQTTDHIHGIKGAAVSAGRVAVGAFQSITSSVGEMNALMSAAPAIIGGVTAAFVGLFTATAMVADKIDGLQEAMLALGIAPEIVSENTDAFIGMAIAVEVCGGSMQKLGNAFLKLNLNLVKSPELWNTLGVEIYNVDGTLRSANEVFWATIQAFEDMEHGAARTTLMYQIFGKNLTVINQICAFGTEEFKELATKIDESITDQDIQNYANFQTAIDKVTVSLKTGLITSLSNMIDINEDGVVSVDEVTAAFERMADKIQEIVGRIKTAFQEIAAAWNAMVEDFKNDGLVDFFWESWNVISSLGGVESGEKFSVTPELAKPNLSGFKSSLNNLTSQVIPNISGEYVGGIVAGNNNITNNENISFTYNTSTPKTARQMYREMQVVRQQGVR